MSKVRYIVRARSDTGALSDFLSNIQNNAEIELVDTIGPQGKPHTAVIAVAPDQAPSFEQRFCNSQHLMIERDRPLSLYN